MDSSLLRTNYPVHALDTDQLRGFHLNIRGMFVATFIMFLWWLVWLLVKYILNLIYPTERGSLYDWRARGGGKRNRASMAPPPPPPAAGGEAGMGAAPAGGMMGGPGGAGATPQGVPNSYDPDWWTAGIESERGYPNESRYSSAVSRAADVARLGFLFGLGGTVISALSVRMI